MNPLRRSLLLLVAVGAVLLISPRHPGQFTACARRRREREVAIPLRDTVTLAAESRTSVGSGGGSWTSGTAFPQREHLLAGLRGGVGVAAAWLPGRLRAEADVELKVHVPLFAVVIVLVAGILVGIGPALHSTGAGLADSLNPLKEDGRSGTATDAFRWSYTPWAPAFTRAQVAALVA